MSRQRRGLGSVLLFLTGFLAAIIPADSCYVTYENSNKDTSIDFNVPLFVCCLAMAIAAPAALWATAAWLIRRRRPN